MRTQVVVVPDAEHPEARPHLSAVSWKHDHSVERARHFAEAWGWIRRAELRDDPEAIEWLFCAGVIAPAWPRRKVGP
jgi:TPR repeat protein